MLKEDLEEQMMAYGYLKDLVLGNNWGSNPPF
jgi:hypothetical protein